MYAQNGEVKLGGGGGENNFLLIFLFEKVIKVILRFDLKNKIWKIDTTNYTLTP